MVEHNPKHANTLCTGVDVTRPPSKKRKGSRIRAHTNDDYNAFAAHTQACQSENCLVKLFLSLTFNPLIVSASSAYRSKWPHEFQELLTRAREQFAKSLQRYPVGGKWYFRHYMRRALRFYVRDIVFKERRQIGLTTWQNVRPTPHPDSEEVEAGEGYWVRETSPHEELLQRLDLEEVMAWLDKTKTVSEQDKSAFHLLVNGSTPQQARHMLQDVPPDYSVVAAAQRVRSAILKKVTGEPLHIGWVACAKCEGESLQRMGIKLGTYNANIPIPAGEWTGKKADQPIVTTGRFERCEASGDALLQLAAHYKKYDWDFKPLD